MFWLCQLSEGTHTLQPLRSCICHWQRICRAQGTHTLQPLRSCICHWQRICRAQGTHTLQPLRSWICHWQRICRACSLCLSFFVFFFHKIHCILICVLIWPREVLAIPSTIPMPSGGHWSVKDINNLMRSWFCCWWCYCCCSGSTAGAGDSSSVGSSWSPSGRAGDTESHARTKLSQAPPGSPHSTSTRLERRDGMSRVRGIPSLLRVKARQGRVRLRSRNREGHSAGWWKSNR